VFLTRTTRSGTPNAKATIIIRSPMNLEQARTNMVEQQIRTWEVLDQDVLDLLYLVPREQFVPEKHRNLAFSDLEIPLEEGVKAGERMWQPKMEARVLQELALRKSDRVLEVGTGSGYLTALLAHRGGHVHTVEIDPKLAELGRKNLARHGVDNVTLQVGDAARGWPSQAPYDVIVLTGSTPALPRAFLDSLAPGGRLFAVVGEAPAMVARLVACSAPGAGLSTNLFETVIRPLQNAEHPPRFRF
jgi:protein-L-isoaspartate(D-aspartate) O-methyltransferase